jgi:acetyl-CoA carboxylase carboxyltransferase component
VAEVRRRFLELCALAGMGQEKYPVGGGVVAGVGLVCGRLVMISASVPTLKGLRSPCSCVFAADAASGGSVNKVTLMKGARIAQIAWENRRTRPSSLLRARARVLAALTLAAVPVVHLTQSAGADLSQQAKVFHKGGGAFRESARRSAAGLPNITVVFGNATVRAFLPFLLFFLFLLLLLLTSLFVPLARQVEADAARRPGVHTRQA